MAAIVIDTESKLDSRLLNTQHQTLFNLTQTTAQPRAVHTHTHTHTYPCTSIYVKTFIDIVHSSDPYRNHPQQPSNLTLTTKPRPNLKLNLKTRSKPLNRPFRL